MQALENSPKAGGTHTRTREEVICSTEFCGTDLGIPHTRTREAQPPGLCQNSDKAIEKIDTTSSRGETSLHSSEENSP